MKTIIFTLLSLAIIASFWFLDTVQPQKQAPSDLPFVKDIDFQRFMGVWYNIASLPNVIETNCKCAQTVDTLESEFIINLSQSCLIYGRNITSKSKIVASVPGYGNWTNWNGPLSAPYWIVNLDPEYQWSIIGQPSRKGFWITSRKPVMEQKLLNELIEWGKQHQFNLTKLEMEDQSCFKHQIQQQIK